MAASLNYLSLNIPTANSVVRPSSRSSPVYNIVLNTAYCCHHTVNFAASDRTSEWGGTGESEEWVWSERTASERCCRASKYRIQLQPHLPQETGTFGKDCEHTQTVRNNKHIILSGNKISKFQGICVSCRNVPVQWNIYSRSLYLIRNSVS